jgi:ComF family protein
MLLDFLFPPEKIDVGKLPLVFPQVCPVCERASLNGLTHYKCSTKYSLDGLFSIYKYEGELRKALIKAKFKPFVFSVYNELLTMNVVYPPWLSGIAVPVPLHFIKQRVRGFNQAEIIAQKIKLPVVTNLLERTFFTKSQKKLNKKERQENIVHAFKVNQKTIQQFNNAAIVLVDDIWTTGATLRVCGKLLKEAGFSKVYAVTLAK